MATLICSELEPVARLRSAIPESSQEMLELLLGMLPQPADQPAPATVITTLAKCLAGC